MRWAIISSMNWSKTPKKTSKHLRNAAPLLRRVFVLACLAACGAAFAYEGAMYRLGGKRATVDSDQPCYRSGRCDSESYSDRIRIQRQDRIAPEAPEIPPYIPLQRGVPEPTAVDQLMPAYKDTGAIRDEFSGSGAAR